MKEDPVREQVMAERDRCSTWMRILAQGIGARLADCYDHEEAQGLIDRINNEFSESVAALQAADKAAQPYWWASRRRNRVTIKKRRKATKETA
jgi:hypothetical protein